jgi:alpha-tubulin suppressor-like RCC1 family protein
LTLLVLALLFLAAPSSAASAGVQAPGSAVFSFGQFGQPVFSPVSISGIAGTVVQIATMNAASYALTSTGEVYAWGNNKYGELGNGTKISSETTAVQVKFPAGVTIASLPNPMPFNTALAIDSTGQVWGWGRNSEEQLCLRRQTITRPRMLPISGVTMASGAGDHTLFVSNGTLEACGLNGSGDLGNGTTQASVTPVAVAGLPNEPVTALASSWQGSGALLADGTYYNWGFNADGQMGDGTTASVKTPIAVTLPAPVQQIYQGGSYAANGQTVALLEDGTVWGWGSNGAGQLGVGNTKRSLTPKQVHIPSGVTVQSVATGGDSSYAIDATGQLWVWGSNRYGELGLPSGANKELTPTTDSLSGLTQVTATARSTSAR